MKPRPSMTAWACGAALVLGITVAAPAPGEEIPVSVQMHVHGSLSEGKGPMWAHTARGENHGLDVMWWTDHDNRISYWKMDGAGRYGWEQGPQGTAPDSGATLEWVPSDVELEDPAADVVTGTASEGSRSFRMAGRAKAGSGWKLLSLRYETGNTGFHRRSLLSELEVRVAIRPPSDLYTNDKIAVGFKLELSTNLDGDPMTLYWIAGAPVPRNTGQWEVWRRLPQLEPGAWNQVVLPITQHALESFPFGDDNSFRRFYLMIGARDGATVESHFDDFQIRILGRRGQDLLEHQRDVINTRYAENMVQLAGFEVTPPGHHVNAFGSNVPLIDYDNYPFATHPIPAVEHIHAHGGLVSYNHIFGAGSGSGLSDEERQALVQRKIDLLLANRAFGVDILEVGYTERRLPIQDHLAVWDALSADNVFLTGNGVSDDHDAEPWPDQKNRMVTWLWLEEGIVTEPAMLQALRAGRVFFGDPILVEPDSAAIDMTTPEGYRMGQTVLTTKDRHKVTAVIEGIQKGDRIRAVVDGRVVRTFTAQGPRFQGTGTLPTKRDTFVRLEVWTQDGKPALFSNPLWFLRVMPEGGLPEARTPQEGQTAGSTRAGRPGAREAEDLFGMTPAPERPAPAGSPQEDRGRR